MNSIDHLNFFSVLYDGADRSLLLNVCRKSPKQNGLITRTYALSDLEAASNEIRQVCDTSDVYFEICLQDEYPEPGKRGKADAKTLLPGVWLDVDVAGVGHKSDKYPKSKAEALEFARGLMPSMIIDSGGGLHCYHLLKEPLIISDLERTKKLVRNYQISINNYVRDRGWVFDSTHDLARLLRVPGTFNHKMEKRPVVVIEYFPEARYDIANIECEPEVSEVSEVSEAGPVQVDDSQALVVRGSAEPGTYPASNAEHVIEHCGFIRHCVEDAETLSEPEWFLALSVIGHCEDGRDIAHQVSTPYLGYDFDECEKKISHVLTHGPITCEKISMNASAQPYCERCNFRGHVKSPIRLGASDAKSQLLVKAVGLVTAAYADPGLPFTDDSLKLLANLQRFYPDIFARVRGALAKMNISVSSIEGQLLNRRTEFFNEAELVPYRNNNCCIIYEKPTKNGYIDIPLSNFFAVITEQIVRDNGIEQEIMFKITGKLCDGTNLPVVCIKSDEFRSMAWVVKHYGARAIVQPGASVADHLRAAVQMLSTEITEQTIYSHSGWREINGAWVYLNRSGALGVDGLQPEIQVDLSGKMAHYSFPETLLALSPVAAVQSSLKIIELTGDSVGFPLICTIYRAPLQEVFPAPFTVFIAGRTGTFKSELAALVLSHFGPEFSAKNLTAEWSSTANALELMAFTAKDAVFVIDDFYPGTSMAEASKMNAVADRIIRGQGNKSGRARMLANGSLRETYISRALILATGEDVPRGASLRARMHVIEIEPGTIKPANLSILQESAGKGEFAAAAAGYIQYLASRIPELKRISKKIRNEIRAEVLNQADAHTRTPEIVADLLFGFRIFSEYAVEIHAITADDAFVLWEKGKISLLDSVRNLTETLDSEDPVQRFLNLLMAAFMNGAAHVESVTGGRPVNSRSFGWSSGVNDTGDETGHPSGRMIGWKDHNFIYLNPDNAHAVTQELASKQGSPLTNAALTIRKRLRERGILIPGSNGELTLTKKINGSKQRVLQLNLKQINKAIQVEEKEGGDLRSESDDNPFAFWEAERDDCGIPFALRETERDDCENPFANPFVNPLENQSSHFI